MPRIIETNPDGVAGNYDPDLRLASFSDARRGFVAGSSSPRAFLETCLERIDRLEGTVQAFAYLDVEGARTAADAATERYRQNRPLSALDGCPVGLKDTLDVRGMPSTMNSPIFENYVAPYDSAAAYALRKAGAAIVGKTQVPELALGRLPPTRNPFDQRRTAGGSSSGSGAAVGAQMVPVTIGNQTSGSLLRPASFSANYGFKPSFGALNIGGMHPIAPSQDHIGPMAASLEDAWKTAWEISSRAGGHGGHPGLIGSAELPAPRKPLRLAQLGTNGWAELDDACLRAFARIRSILTDAGISIIDAHTDEGVLALEEKLRHADRICNDVTMYEMRWPLVAYLDKLGPEALGVTGTARLERGLAMTPADYRNALAEREELRALVAKVGAGVDGFITMASSGPAPIDNKGGARHNDQANSHLITGSRAFLSPWSMIGGPAYSLPFMAIDGMPQGLQLAGLPGLDFSITAIARWMDETILG